MIALSYKRISDFCNVGSGTTPSRQKDFYYGGEIPWVKSGELRENQIFLTEETITDRALKETSLRLVPAGALLVAMYGATVGRVGRLAIEATTNQAICHIIPDKALADPQYLFYALQQKSSELISKSVGGAQPNISQGIIKETSVYLPSLDEQKRIAAILDQADVLRRLRQQSIDLLNQFEQTLFYETFGDPATNPKSWPIGTIDNLTASTQYGTSSKAYEIGRLPILRMGNITTAGRFNFDELKFIDIPDRDLQKYTVSDGDILFNRTNSPDLVGKTAVYRGEKTYAYAGYLVRLKTNDKAIPEFIGTYLNSAYGKKILRGMCKSIIGMANINARELKTIPIPIVPVQLQITFANKLRAVMQTLPIYELQKKELTALFFSLQNSAFNGRL